VLSRQRLPEGSRLEGMPVGRIFLELVPQEGGRGDRPLEGCRGGRNSGGSLGFPAAGGAVGRGLFGRFWLLLLRLGHLLGGFLRRLR
jgi:hypothetical protein